MNQGRDVQSHIKKIKELQEQQDSVITWSIHLNIQLVGEFIHITKWYSEVKEW